MTTFSELERAHEARVYETTVAIKQGRAVMAKILMGEAVAIMACLKRCVNGLDASCKFLISRNPNSRLTVPVPRHWP